MRLVSPATQQPSHFDAPPPRTTQPAARCATPRQAEAAWGSSAVGGETEARPNRWVPRDPPVPRIRPARQPGSESESLGSAGVRRRRGRVPGSSGRTRIPQFPPAGLRKGSWPETSAPRRRRRAGDPEEAGGGGPAAASQGPDPPTPRQHAAVAGRRSEIRDSSGAPPLDASQSRTPARGSRTTRIEEERPSADLHRIEYGPDASLRSKDRTSTRVVRSAEKIVCPAPIRSPIAP